VTKQIAPVTRREIVGVLVLSLGFGLVGIDRFLISTLYPTIARDLHLDYGDIGSITAFRVPSAAETNI
jgi:predicted MFS family arabinose efflux permease